MSYQTSFIDIFVALQQFGCNLKWDFWPLVRGATCESGLSPFGSPPMVPISSPLTHNRVYLLLLLSYSAGCKSVSARPFDPNTMTNTAVEAIASSNGNNSTLVISRGSRCTRPTRHRIQDRSNGKVWPIKQLSGALLCQINGLLWPLPSSRDVTAMEMTMVMWQLVFENVDAKYDHSREDGHEHRVPTYVTSGCCCYGQKNVNNREGEMI